MANSIHVLYVDAEPGSEAHITEVLQRENDQFTITTETTVRDAIDRLDSDTQTIDCVVSDYEMPHQTGLEFLETVRNAHPDLPFILFTDKGSEDVASDAISAGATDYLQRGRCNDQYTILANRIENAVDRYRSQRRAREYERITAVMRKLNRALVYADSVTEIEREVCDILSDAEPYLTACIAGVDTAEMQIEPRTWDGDAAGYFDALDMSVDAESPGRHAPGGRAFHDREIAISQNIPEDQRYEQWREAAIERGFRSLAVIPIEHENNLYGLLALFADRRYAFDGRERDLLTELGDDIAHAVHAQEVQSDLRKTATRLEALFERSPDMINIHDMEGNLIDPNPRLSEETGYEKSELAEMKVWELDRESDPEEFVALWEGMDVGDSHRLEGRYQRKDGSTFPVEVHIRRLDLVGEPRFIAIARDITERRKNERKHQQIIARMNDAVVEVDSDWQITLINERTEELSGIPESELVGRGFWDVFAEARGTRFEAEYRRAMNTRERTSLVDYYSGVDEWFDIQVYPNDDGGLAFYFRTVTEYKERQHELRRIERRYQAILEDPNILAGVLDAEGRVLDINQTALEYIDAAEGDVLDEPIWETPWWSPEQRPIIEEKVTEALAGDYVRYEADLTKPDGEPYSVSGTIRPVTGEDGESVSLVISARDVTSQKEYQRGLELRTKAINEAPVGIIMTDPSEDDNPISYVNDEFLEITGYTREETLGRNCRFLQGPETAEQPLTALRTAIDAQEPVTVELRNYRKEGSLFWNRVSIAPVHDEQGDLINYIGFQQDVTERKQRQQQLQVIDRVLRHNVRNDMNVIHGHAELIESRGTGESSRHASRIISKSNQLIALTEKERRITELLAERPRLTEIDLSSVLENSVAIARQKYPAATIVVDCPAEVTLRTSTEFNEAIDELLQNAITHNDSSTPTVSVTVVEGDERAHITIADDGPPMPDMERAVLLGQSHEKPLYHGGGFGLWLVNLIVTRSEGAISYEECEVTGNEIELTVPRA